MVVKHFQEALVWPDIERVFARFLRGEGIDYLFFNIDQIKRRVKVANKGSMYVPVELLDERISAAYEWHQKLKRNIVVESNR